MFATSSSHSSESVPDPLALISRDSRNRGYPPRCFLVTWSSVSMKRHLKRPTGGVSQQTLVSHSCNWLYRSIRTERDRGIGIHYLIGRVDLKKKKPDLIQRRWHFVQSRRRWDFDRSTCSLWCCGRCRCRSRLICCFCSVARSV